jgi:hypothetical protein
METRVLLLPDGSAVADSWQDVEPILERNSRLRGEPQRSDWGRHVASIPNVILVAWLNEEAARGNAGLRMYTPEFNALVARKLADPAWKHLRTDAAFNGTLGFGS